MPRRRSSKRSRGRSARGPSPLARLREAQRPELEQRHLDVAGLGLLALAAFFAFVFYLGWDGGKVGGGLAIALRFLLGGVAYLIPLALLAAGSALVLRPMLPSIRPFRAGWACLLLALTLGLGGTMFGLGPAHPVRHGFFHPAYFRHHGGLVGDALYWATKTLSQDVGAHIVFVFLLLAGVLLLSGASVASVLRVTRTGIAASARRVKRSTSEFAAVVAGHESSEYERGTEADGARPPDVEPRVRATHVEAPPLDPDDVAPAPAPRAPFPRFQRPATPAAETDSTPDEDARTPQGERRSEVTEADDVEYTLPSPSLLTRSKKGARVDTAARERTGKEVVDALGHFDVEAEVVGAVSGPHVTRYELRLAPGTKVSKVAQLKDDLAYALAATEIRILAPIPGKQAVGVEVPNADRRIVHLGDVFQEPPADWSPLSVWLGKDIAGRAIGADLAKMPHLLVAGTTGAGKSACVNAMLSSILLRATPHEVRLVLVDPKQVELNHYESIPHLLTPVITSPRMAANALQNLVKEMEQRYGIMSLSRTRGLVELNRARERRGEAPLPYILCVIDELADLMMVAPADVEDSIIRLAQKARAVGIHLVLATQSPRVDVITGMIKANVPSRIAFAVSSQTDSRVILDQNGAESLLGQGDLLFSPIGSSRLQRIQGAYIDEDEIERLTEQWRRQGEPDFHEELLEELPSEKREGGDGELDPDEDPLLSDAIVLVAEMQTASTSMLQRRLRLGYTRAGRMIDMLERRGVISGYEGSKPRQVLITEADLPRVLAGLDSATHPAATVTD